jgi:hypothetical protein
MQDMLGPAWRALLADFRARVAIGRIRLDGTPTDENAEAVSVPLPLVYAKSYDFDLAANTVNWHRGAWRSVWATLNTRAASVGAPPGAPIPLDRVPVTWCDEELVDRYETAEVAAQLLHEAASRDRPAGHSRRFAGLSRLDIDFLQEDWRRFLAPAKEALHTDFRTRIADGRIQLFGLQIAPQLAPERARLSSTWAGRMQFDWRTQTVKIEGAIFADVEGVQAPFMLPADRKPAAPKRERGRPGFPMDELVAIARTRLSLRLSNNQREADMLLREFRRLHQSARPPGVRTIKDHVTKIYAAAEEDAVSLKPPK